MRGFSPPSQVCPITAWQANTVPKVIGVNLHQHLFLHQVFNFVWPCHTGIIDQTVEPTKVGLYLLEGCYQFTFICDIGR